jgi:hypothetical protein
MYAKPVLNRSRMEFSTTLTPNPLTEYFRCPEDSIRVAPRGALSADSGYFRFGDEAICYGKYSGRTPSASPKDDLFDGLGDTLTRNGITSLPFDLDEVLSNLRYEQYAKDWHNEQAQSALATIYYLLRPLIPFGLRSRLKRFYSRDWKKLAFPRWPVDCSVDALLEQLLLLAVKSNPHRRIPFIWFWPEGAPSSAIMTHDVETEFGQKFSSTLMDIDDSYGIKASFQVVPEKRYSVTPSFLASLRNRGFEVVVHDLNHDGHLYKNKEEFLKRAAKINSYGKQFQAEGFRAAVLYRRQLWFDALDFSFDMSVPNVAHLDPQHGGCCTVMPYFIGNIVELPVTTTQDYMLFHILNDRSIGLWKRQIDLIMQKHGLISFIVHPDYVAQPRERATYEELLAHLARLRQEKGIWMATPGEVNRWWRQRSQMKIVDDEHHGLRIEGAGSERARIAFASEKDGQLALTLEEANEPMHSPVMHSRP